MKIIRESCIENFDGALWAQNRGADCVEICDNLAEAGTTPSYGVLLMCVKHITIPMTILVRPRGGNFVYTDEECEIVNEDILMCKKIGIKSIRVGALTSKNKLDEKMMLMWKKLAGEIDISCHMAFDESVNYKESIDMLVSWGYNAILTKGHPTKAAPENSKSLKDLIEYANNRIIIIPGHEVNRENVDWLAKETGAKMLHGREIA